MIYRFECVDSSARQSATRPRIDENGPFSGDMVSVYSKGEELVSPRIHTRTDADGGTRVNERGDPSLMQSVNLNKRLLLLLELEQ